MIPSENSAPSRFGLRGDESNCFERDPHVLANTMAQWIAAGLIYAALAGAAFGYHLVRCNPASCFTANKCVGIASILAIACALAIGPLSRLSRGRLAGLLPLRRSLGVTGALATLVHVGLSLAAFPEKFPLTWYVAHWPSIVVACLGEAVLALLVVYSWPRGLRKLGPALWLLLHKLSWLALGLALGHVLLLGKMPGWVKWFQTFDQPLPPGALTTSVLLLCAFALKGLDMVVERLRQESTP